MGSRCRRNASSLHGILPFQENQIWQQTVAGDALRSRLDIRPIDTPFGMAGAYRWILLHCQHRPEEFLPLSSGEFIDLL